MANSLLIKLHIKTIIPDQLIDYFTLLYRFYMARLQLSQCEVKTSKNEIFKYSLLKLI
jgi:hypothetical protein